MIHTRLVLLSLVLLLPLAAFAQSTPQEKAPPPPVGSDLLRLNIEFGGQLFSTSNDRWTKFMQFRDVPKNFTLTNLDFAVEKEGSPWSFTGLARDAAQLDQRYRLVLEKTGKMRAEFRYEGFPQFISRLVKAPYTEAAPGVLTLADTFQSALQAATNAGVPPLVNDLLLNTPFADLQTRRQKFSFLYDLTLTNHWDYFLQFSSDRKTGRKPIGFGTYERTQLATGGFFTVLGDELPEPIDNRTSSFRTGASFHNQRALLRFEYGVSWFENQVTALRWENPFSLTDQQGSLPAGAANRWRFGTGQLDLYPDNLSHTFTVSGRVNLPAESFFSALASWSFLRQDDDFLPWTLNTAIVTSVPAGVVPTNAATLPRANLDGQVNLFNSDVVLGTRKWDKVALTGRYRIYRYQNDTPQLPLPGYAAFGEAFWRTNIANVPFTDLHEPNSYTRQQTSIEAVWKPMDALQWKLEPFWEGWEREHRQAEETNEYGAKTQFIYKPLNWFNTRVHYRYASRKPELYVVGPFEFSALTTLPPNGFASGLRMFDQAHRNRNEAGIVLNFGATGPWMLSASYDYLGDRYDRNFFGLGTYLQGSVQVDLNYTPSDKYGLAFFYNRDRIRHHYRSIAKGAGANTWVLANEWDRDSRDLVDSFGLGFNAACLEQKINFNASYDLSFAKQTITTQNPNTVQANAFNDATAFPWPDVKNRFQELRFEASYRFRPNMEAGVRYLFEPYRLDDFAWDIMRPYMFGFEAPENDVRRMLFLDSRYGSTDAHLVGFFVRYHF